MKKILTVAAIFLLAASMGAAVETGNNERVNIIRDKHAIGPIDEVREGDAEEFERREGRKGLNAVNVKVTVADLDGDGWGDAVSTRAKKGDRVALVGFVRGGGDCDDTRDELHPRCAKEGRKGLNAVNVKVLAILDEDSDGDGIGDDVSELARGIEKEDVKRGKLAHELTHVVQQGEAISKREARKGRNPQTGKEIKIPAKIADTPNGDKVMHILTTKLP